MHKSRVKTWAHLSLLAANIIYGMNYSIAKAVMPDSIRPLALVSLRTVTTAILFWITSLFMPKESVSRKELLYLFGCSFFGMVINQVLFLIGLNYTSPVNSSIIISTNPIFAFVFAALILKLKPIYFAKPFTILKKRSQIAKLFITFCHVSMAF